MERENRQLIERMSFYDKLSTYEQDYLKRSTLSKEYTKGEFVYSKNSPCMGMIFVVYGCLRAHTMNGDGREIALYRITEGEVCVLSASCALNCLDFEIMIEAESDTQIVQIPSVAFAELSKNVSVENFVLRIAVQRFTEIVHAMQDMLFLSVDERICEFLLTERKRQGNHIMVTHDELAKNLGTAREVVTRSLKRLSVVGAVSLARGAVTVTDAVALESRRNAMQRNK